VEKAIVGHNSRRKENNQQYSPAKAHVNWATTYWAYSTQIYSAEAKGREEVDVKDYMTRITEDRSRCILQMKQQLDVKGQEPATTQ